ncbi:MAG: FeoB-associated Cys-rich membrane protein [Clostridiales bacterium]|nr:FeoB-associated Cys-rich membrane protein [Clostridiales bacterium]
MNLASIVLLLLILAVIALIVVHLWRNRTNGCCGCGRTDCPSRKAGKQPNKL